MEEIIGIVCEYNPFHAGHAYHIKESRRIAVSDCEPENLTCLMEAENKSEMRNTCNYQSMESGGVSLHEDEPLVICVMSGDFVQRGEWAILPKHERAESAVRGGADLVVELPLPWCLSSAEIFAAGAVDILLRLGITCLSFGCECGDISVLERIAEMVSAPGFNELVSDYLRSGREQPYPEARSAVLCSLGAPAGLLKLPNNLLGVEYLKALASCGGVNFRGQRVRPVCVKRLGSGHDELLSGNNALEFRNGDTVYPSAKEQRRKMKSEGKGADDAALDLAAVSRLRMLCTSGLGSGGDSANGAGERIKLGITSGARTMDEICSVAKTKSLTYSRLKRIIMRETLGLGTEFPVSPPPYARILAENERGRKYLASLRKANGCIPVITQPKRILKMDAYSQKVFAVGAYAKDFYDLGFGNEPLHSCGEDYRTGPVYISDCEI